MIYIYNTKSSNDISINNKMEYKNFEIGKRYGDKIAIDVMVYPDDDNPEFKFVPNVPFKESV